MACTLMSVTSLTPSCGPELLLTKYQRLSQLVRYTAFLEDATSALVRGQSCPVRVGASRPPHTAPARTGMASQSGERLLLFLYCGLMWNISGDS